MRLNSFYKNGGVCVLSAILCGIFLVSIFFPQPRAFSAFRIGSAWCYGTKFVYLRDVARYYGFQISYHGGYCEMQGKDGVRIRFQYDKREGYLNGTKVHYMFAPLLKGSEPLISEMDLLLFIDPALRSASLKRYDVKTIVLDPGHGDNDKGASGTFVVEKKAVLAIAVKVRNLLVARGYNVIMTRSNDTFIPLDRRPYVAAANKADLFVSIHCNSASPFITGTETFAFTPIGVTSSNGGTPHGTKTLGNLNDRNNSRLALELQRSLVSQLGSVDRGVKFANFKVLRDCPCPAALVECGFISSRYEEKLLAQDSYQNQIAAGIVKGVEAYQRAVK